MEKIINYKVSDFFQLKDYELFQNYLIILDVLQPLKSIKNPKAKWYNKQPKQLIVKAIRKLKLGEVEDVKRYFRTGTIESIIATIKLIIDVSDKEILNFTIVQLYGIISFIKEELIAIAELENQLQSESNDDFLERVNAIERMSKFGILNTIDSLAKEDILRWKSIEELPYLTVYYKLLMDKEKNKIQQEIAELQKQKQLKN